MRASSRPIRVAFVITGLGLGGAERQLVRIVSNLDRARYAPMVMSLLPPVAFEDELHAHAVPLVQLGMKRGVPTLRAIAKAVRALRHHRVDVIVAFMVHGYLLARVLGPVVGARAVISSVRTEMPHRQPLEWLTSRTDRLSFATVVNGTRVADTVVERGTVSAERVRVIFNAVPFAAAEEGQDGRDRLRRDLGMAPDAFVWISVARLVEEKDHASLLEAFSSLHRVHPRARLLLVGDGPLRGPVEAQISRLELGRAVSCLGTRRDVEALLGAADAFVLSSKVEGSPNALLEALVAGLPSVASRVGGVPDLLPTEEVGLAVPAGDVVALEGAMDQIMRMSPQERRAMGRLGQQLMQANHAIPRVVSQWEQLISEALANA